jgi:hypothetical protein
MVIGECHLGAGSGVRGVFWLVAHWAARLPLRADGVGEPGHTCRGEHGGVRRVARAAERLAQDLPNARLDWIENARSLSPEDEPGRLAELIASFVREPAARATA